MSTQERARVRAPEITGGRGWLNTDKPLSLAALKGKVVLLDFWTYGCINCIHIIPDLKKLEEKYSRQLVVIGVHSAKFENEKQTENIRRIILRYEIEHPVYNDADFKVWESYGIRAWPTQILIDPAGYVVGSVSGEGNFEVIDQAIGKTVADFRQRGELNEEPLKLSLERAKVGDLPLAFPGKLVADAKGNRLFIADSNHNRIVITKLDGTLVETIGAGVPGAADGSFDKATFFRPQGMALDGETLYVADTENHLVRKIDLKARTVQTLAGTGKQSQQSSPTGPVREVALNSPWDLQLVGRTLYIAMAGPHQIWKIDLDKQETSTYAGSGREARKDGILLDAAFAQPSGLASDGNHLYVADSESNIIRSIEFETGLVTTLVGGDLFDFGDVDGAGNGVRLQHPLGLVAFGDHVLIADTYNHKIKELDPGTRTVKSLFGNGPGQLDGSASSFYEPGGLSVANDKLYIADTNNHAIRVVDLKTKTAATLRINGLQPPATAAAGATDSETGPNTEELAVPAQQVGVANDGSLIIQVELPNGYHLNPMAPQRYRVSVEKGFPQFSVFTLGGSGPVVKSKETKQTSKSLRLPIVIPFASSTPGEAELRIQTTLFYCREDNTGTCRIKTLVWRAPVTVVKDAAAPTQIKVSGKLTAE
jgi:DNA-binding beta-propeller fold protein YncE